MEVCQAMTGSGGWPLTIIMTPDRKPFFAATYLPKHSRYGVAGLMHLLPEIARQWETDHDRLAEAGEESCRYLSIINNRQKEWEEPTKRVLNEAVTMYESSFDPVYGGFGRAPKFPAAHNLLFLMCYAQLERHSGAMSMAEKTLEQMAKGGIYDHIGGGFSRYSTDNRYLVPHFEKMLYDNALLLLAYTEAYRLTGHSWYQGTAEGIIAYVLREMTHPQGGFYSAQDADSEGVEGKYYVFTTEEILQMLGDTDGERFCEWFGITKKGNFEGKNIPNRIGKDIQGCIRARDMAARYNGEEFWVLLPSTPGIGAVVVAERLRERISAMTFQSPEGPWHLTASIGVACLSAHVTSNEHLVVKANQCLAQSQRLGGNQIIFDWDEALEMMAEE
jgi:uncharacterized protein YyaL (SSP411 family)